MNIHELKMSHEAREALRFSLAFIQEHAEYCPHASAEDAYLQFKLYLICQDIVEDDGTLSTFHFECRKKHV
ncbi:MAG: hypothetical protein Q7T91_00510 [Sulfuricurvum sp.]|nr:hypothetical protein [Sulfuricurvum sp.]